jgi:hypothetical protein
MKLQPENMTSDRGRAPAERHGKISATRLADELKQKNGSRGKTQARKTNSTHTLQKHILSLKTNKNYN